MITPFSIPSQEQILQQLLQNYQAIATTQGFTVSIAPGTEIFIRMSAVAAQQAVLYQLSAAAIDQRMPDSASGSNLDRVLNQFGLVRKSATSAQGYVQLIASAPQTLTSGMLLSGPNGLQYQVSISGVYQPASLALANTGTINTSYVPISAVNKGQNTDLGINQIMTWININPLMQSTCLVTTALTGGSDLETDAQARFRLYQTLQNPQNAGNSQFLANLASNIDPVVEVGFVYPDAFGAGSQAIVLMGYQSDGYYIGRDIPHLITDNNPSGQPNVGPYNNFSQNLGTNLVRDTSSILGQLPAVVANQYATQIYTVNNQATTYSFGLNLPYPVGDPVNGLGNGWVNNSGQTFPTPSPNGTIPGICPVVSLTSSVNIVVQAYSTTSGVDTLYDPILGLTTINWIDRSGAANNGWRIVSSVIQSFTKATTAHSNTYNYTLVLSIPLVCGITVLGQTDFYGQTQVAVNDLIFPASVNAQNYLNSVMLSYAQLGPGQATNNINLQALGANRFPSIGSIYSPVLGTQFLQGLTQNNPEIYNAQKLYNSTDTGNLIPNIPNPNLPSGCWIPQNIAFYDQSRIQTS